MSATGDTLGQKLHDASVHGVAMSDDESQRSLSSWTRIGNALVDFFANMGEGNPITFTCGTAELTIAASHVTAKVGSSELNVDQSGITMK